MPKYICSSCGNSFAAEPDPQGRIVCGICGMSQAADSAERPLPAGTRIGGYEIIRHLAAGGSGSVYLAEQLTMERKVALKILNRDQVSSDDAERFLEEARNAAKFEHPHVVSVIDSGISPEGCCFLAMQYVDGETLEEVLNRGRTFPEDESLIIVLMVADALRSVWNKYKMFHKDIKPGNIMLTQEKNAMLLDMGIAQKRGESKLADGSIEGSPFYMSPEQARGEELTWSSDLYSLGATLYQMVTGQYLYTGETVESILQQHDSAPFPDPAVRMPEKKISAPMTRLLQRMLAKSASDRYSSWDEFIGEAKSLLETILSQEGSAVSSTVRKQYMQLNAGPDRPERKSIPDPGAVRSICTALLIFIFAAMLLGGMILYLAVRKNSGNARKLLEPIRVLANDPHQAPDALDEVFKKAAPYFNRFGVYPSIRKEFQNCRDQAARLRADLRQEEKSIIGLESRTAECLQSVDREMRQAGKLAAANQLPQALRHTRQAGKELEDMISAVRQAQAGFRFQPNAERSQQLIKRLETAKNWIGRESRLYRKRSVPDRVHQPHPVRPAPVRTPPVRPAPRGEKPPEAPAQADKVPPGNPPARENEQDYRKILEREKDRIRLELLLQSMPEKIRTGNPVWTPRFRRKSFPVQNRQFDQWTARMKQLISRAAAVWNAVYDTHQELAGFRFTVITPDGEELRMDLKTIRRDQVFLGSPGIPKNEIMTFDQLFPAEWMDFLRMTAKRKKLEDKLESYFLADGRFFAVEKSADPFIRSEIPPMREVLSRCLAGQEIPGAGRKSEKEIAAGTRKFQIDPFFARFRAKTNKSQSITPQQTAKNPQKGAK